MKNFESWMLGYILNSVWQVPVLFAAAWLAARVLRSSGAAAGHRVWVSALVLQSLLPACSVQPWNWLRGTALAGSHVHKVRPGQVTVVMGPGVGIGVLHIPAVFLALIVAGYGAAFLYFAVRLLWGIRKTSAIRRAALPIRLTEKAAQYWNRCNKRFGIHDAHIAVSTSILGPLTMGVKRMLVLLPANMVDGLPEEDLHAIIAHEFAHMFRRDYAKSLLYELLSLPAMYHPLFWATRAHVMESREEVCDRMAAEAVAGVENYARSLLRLASSLVRGTSARVPYAIGIFDANTFERRIMKLTLRQREIQGARRFAILAACVAFGMGTCASALALRTYVYAPSVEGSGKTASKKTAPASVPAGVMAERILKQTMPIYPPAAKKAKIEGSVLLDAVIGKDGTIENLKAVSGPRELQQSALDAVRQWTYKPYLVNGDPVEVETTITVTYSLRE